MNSTRLYVSNLPWDMSLDDIFTVFGTVSKVIDVYMVRDEDGRFNGVAFVTVSDGLLVMKSLNGASLCGREIAVRPAKKRQNFNR